MAGYLVAFAEVISQAVETVRPTRTLCGSRRLFQIFSTTPANIRNSGGRIALPATRADVHVVVAIRDNGVGIPPDLSPKIFDMFTQASIVLNGTMADSESASPW